MGLAALVPSNALAIDVSGLRVEGGASGGDLASQLKAAQPGGSSPSPVPSANTARIAQSTDAPARADETSTAARAALRTSEPKALSDAEKIAGRIVTYDGGVAAPSGYATKSIPVSFRYPADWLQLDRSKGGIQYVDQRDGSKLYVLRAPLPEGETLGSVDKAWVGKVLFDPAGTIAASGNDVEDYKVTSSTTSSSIFPCTTEETGVCRCD